METKEALERDLDEYAGSDPEIDIDEEPKPPLDADTANRMLRRLRRLNEDQRQIDEIAESEIARIRQWQQDRSSGVENARQWLLRSLEGFARASFARNGVRTLNLPNGKLSLRKASKRTIVVDPEAFLTWATANGREEYLRRPQPVPNLAGLAKLETSTFLPQGEVETAHVVLPDGEIIPGVVAQRDVADSFSAKEA